MGDEVDTVFDEWGWSVMWVHYVPLALRPRDLWLRARRRAAQQHDAKLGFDAEDFHRGELTDTPDHAMDRAITADLEARYIPHCNYVIAASDGIADAYTKALGIDRSTTVLSVFPWAERGNSVLEVVEDGVAGFVGDTIDLVEAVGNIDILDRRATRERCEQYFSGRAVVDRYERLHEGQIRQLQ